MSSPTPFSRFPTRGLLSTPDFKRVVENAPLIAIDLLVHDAAGRMLLGWRTNPPAKDYWFVPGGRVRKNETLDDAFARISEAELGTVLQRQSARIVGTFEHFYRGDFSGDADATTHYVVLAHALVMDALLAGLPCDQHSAYRWASAAEAHTDPRVHPYTLAYFPPALAGASRPRSFLPEVAP